MIHQKKASFVAIAIAITMLTTISCKNGDNDSDYNNVISESDRMKYDIVGNKWCFDPANNPEGPSSDIYIPPYEDNNRYYAFNYDSTVDFYWGNLHETGTYSIDNNMVTCLFEEMACEHGEDYAFDGDYNSKVIFEYKNKRLYRHDYQHRKSNNKWVSDFTKNEGSVPYLTNAGYYVNCKYTVGIEGYSYDTTADAMSIVERYNWRTEIYYMNGKRNGIYKKYVDQTNSTEGIFGLRVFGRYEDGMPVGTWYFFDGQGQLDYEISNIHRNTDLLYNYKYKADAIEYTWDDTQNTTVYFNDNFVLKDVRY